MERKWQTQSWSKEDKRHCPEDPTCTAKHYRTCSSPSQCFSHIRANCIGFTQGNLHVRGLMLPLLLSQECPFLPTLLCPGLRGAVGSTGSLKVDIFALDLGTCLSGCVLPAHLKAYLVLAVLASRWEKRQISIMLSDVFLLRCPW